MKSKTPVKQNKKALVFTAHPDDHICAAGTLMFLKDRGFIINEIVATGGEKGVWWTEDGRKKTNFEKQSLQKEREKEISAASKLIGISNTIFLNLPDSEVSRNFELIEKIIGIVRREKPSVVFVMNPSDYHHDHREIGKIATEAIERASWSNQTELGDPMKIPLVLYMEGFYFGKTDIVVDITPYIQRKKAILDVYASQIDPSERKLLESMNTYHAFFRRDRKVLSAEAFELPKEFPVYLNKVIEFFK